MMLREYQPADRAPLEEIHGRRALSCEFPETDSPLVLAKLVLADDSGRPVAAVFGRLTAEIDLVVDGAEGSPEDRWNWLKLLAGVAENRLWQSGLDSAVAFVPMQIARSYGRRLGALGFERGSSVPFRRRVSEPLEWMGAT
jgi:hypothetical protein